MAFTFTPRSDEDIAKNNLLAEGEYDFEVIAATEGVSRASGQPMVTTTIQLFTSEGVRVMKDYFVASQERKWKDFCLSVGMDAEYNAGRVEPATLAGRAGKLRLGVEEGRDKGDGSGEKWPPKNSVKGYVRAKASPGAVIPPASAQPVAPAAAIPPRQPTPPAATGLEDDVPF